MKTKEFIQTERLAQTAVQKKNPHSLQISVIQNGKSVYFRKFGPHYKIFDTASLTKILVTVPLLMILQERKKLILNQPVSSVLKFLKNTPAGRVAIRDLLRHLSGLEWWRPYYKDLLRWEPSERLQVLQHKFKKEVVRKTNKCIYSDLDFILLGWIVEDLFQMTLDEAARFFIFKPLGMDESFFNSGENYQQRHFAPSEKTKRRGLIRSTPQDDNCWSMGGVSGHAGLFSTLNDVSVLTAEFLRVHKGAKDSLWAPRTLRMFTKRATAHSQGDWGLGFALPTLPDTNAGRLISSNAFGHWAFTGPSIWIDPERNAAVVILSNRTFPDSNDQERYKEYLLLRKLIHDSMWEQIDATK